MYSVLHTHSDAERDLHAVPPAGRDADWGAHTAAAHGPRVDAHAVPGVAQRVAQARLRPQLLGGRRVRPVQGARASMSDALNAIHGDLASASPRLTFPRASGALAHLLSYGHLWAPDHLVEVDDRH